MAAKAGWYHDTTKPGQERYWDGGQWTDQRRGATGPSAAAKQAASAAVSKLSGCLVGGSVLYLVGAWFAAYSWSKVWTFSLDADKTPDSSEILAGVLVGSAVAPVGVALLVIGLIGFGVKLGREAARV